MTQLEHSFQSSVTAGEEGKATNDQEQQSDFVSINRPTIMCILISLYGIWQSGVLKNRISYNFLYEAKWQKEDWVSDPLAYSVTDYVLLIEGINIGTYLINRTDTLRKPSNQSHCDHPQIYYSLTILD